MFKCSVKKVLGHLDLNVELSINSGETMVILGASGCGKSTLLNIIAGFMSPDKGELVLENRDITNLPIYKREIGYIQQRDYLFPHLCVKDNLLYGVKKNKANREQEYKRLMKRLGIEGLESHYPSQLSGGQRQRVAIGRVLLSKPKMILWDEPFSALDHQIRQELRSLVEDLKQDYEIPMIFVTHDLEEAYQLSDTLGVMHEGQLCQVGKRDIVFNKPNSVTTASILGVVNMIPGVILSDKHVGCDTLELKIDDHETLETGSQVFVGIRPEQILYVREDEDDPHSRQIKENIFDATVLNLHKNILNYKLRIKIEGLSEVLYMGIPPAVYQRYDLYEGCRIRVLMKYKSLMIFQGAK